MAATSDGAAWPSSARPVAMNWPDGFHIAPRVPPRDPRVIGALLGVPTTILADVRDGDGALSGLRAFHRHGPTRVCGSAVTVETAPGDNLMIHKALLMAEPGDVLVVDGRGDCSTALVGGLMRTTALARGIAGFVIDGALRDIDEWAEGGVAAYARGHCPRGPRKNGPGRINGPVVVGGERIAPGDLIVADSDGVVALPAAIDLPDLLEEGFRRKGLVAKVAAANRAGTPDAGRIDAILRALGCPIEAVEQNIGEAE